MWTAPWQELSSADLDAIVANMKREREDADAIADAARRLKLAVSLANAQVDGVRGDHRATSRHAAR